MIRGAGEVPLHASLKRRLFLFSLLSGVLLGALVYPWLSVLEISSVSTGSLIWCTTVKEGEEFVLAFTHSVNKRPVFDTLKVQGDHLVIVKSVYDAFGAGMPDVSTTEGQFSVLPGGWLQWCVNRSVPEIILRVGEVANHRLTIRAQDYSLRELVEPGTAVVFRVRRDTILAAVKGRCRQ